LFRCISLFEMAARGDLVMSVRLLACLAVVAGMLVTGVASAQDLKHGEFSVQRFTPALGPRNFITVQGARTDGKMAFSLGVFGNYGDRPFVITTCVSASDCASNDASKLREIRIVETLITGALGGTLTVAPQVQLGLYLPYTFSHGQGITTDPDNPAIGQQSRTGLRGLGLGDPMAEVKIRAYGNPTDRHVLGLSFFGTAPVAHAISSTKDTYIGDWSLTAGGRAIYDLLLGRFTFGVNVGGAYRKEAWVGSAHMGSELRYGGAAGFQISPVLAAMAEVFGSTRLGASSGVDAVEGDLALQLHPLGSEFLFMGGAGLGLNEGIGAPRTRIFAGISFVHESSDQDADGLNDDKDQCMTAPEDLDGYQDADGCPDPDNDGDGMADARDKCPNEPETKNGFQDDDGCPDDIADRDQDGIADADDKCPDQGGSTVVRQKGDFYGCPDRDKDGLPDKTDKCPQEPEDTDGFQDVDGCPDPDNDNDGINDADDQCVDQPEVMNGFQDEDGCPDSVPDSDRDGIPDNKDRCPQAPENYNGYQDDDGCPDRGNALVEIRTDDIAIRDVVNFAKDSDKIVGKNSFLVLDAMAAALVHHPEIFQIEVGGHTDNQGDAAHNRDLSKRRAAAVAEYLHGHGVESRRLTAAGYGPDRAIASNKTPAGRAKNRRVEFNILSSTKKQGSQPPPPKPPQPAEPVREIDLN
jgi:outer membrane protein OmpA-like peptidoglycan-associated protein